MPKTIFSGAHHHVVEILLSARRKAGLTQSQLAALIGKDQKFISLIERGQRRVDVLEFYVLAKALGTEPAKLYSELIRKLHGKIEI